LREKMFDVRNAFLESAGQFEFLDNARNRKRRTDQR
jgi:hypothetical protein